MLPVDFTEFVTFLSDRLSLVGFSFLLLSLKSFNGLSINVYIIIK